MAANVPSHECYKCGQLGHFARFCHLSRRNQVSNPNSALVRVNPPLLTGPHQSLVNQCAGNYGSGQYSRGSGWYSTNQRLSCLEDTVSRIKVRHDAEEEREKTKRDEDERKKKEIEKENRCAEERKEREDFHRRMAEEMNVRFDKVCEVLETKKYKDSSSTIAKLQAEVESLQKRKVADPPSDCGTVMDEATARRLRELEDSHKLSQEIADRKVAALEEEVVIVRLLHDHATSEAATWKQEALRPGNKRGSTTLPRTMEAVDLAEAHRREVDFLKELRSKDLNGRRVAEQELEKIKESKLAADLEAERLKEELARMNVTRSGNRPLGTNLKTKLNEVATARPKDKGKQIASTSKEVTRANDREGFMADARKFLKPLKMNAIKEICAKEGVTYTTLDRTKEHIAVQRAARALDSNSKVAEVQDVFEDTDANRIDATASGDEETQS
ncbi:hypothetical protein CBR_g51441 [Chara braunii]|uniref:CCHC-type domain-containing protein n=1 Tax=Chara braunii TaxID=69332 RepID=A0A388K676_CHABU|nr:hypothetical protein CBR_g51441 [Chara braunii]|eukprot:GBG65558.1 hypothetical protein CBR_g51441 [Chara braunii]